MQTTLFAHRGRCGQRNGRAGVQSAWHRDHNGFSHDVRYIVNGPVVRALDMNCTTNAFGPGNRANATIGRAVRLTLQNAGGARSGETDMATLGQPGKYAFCFAENETESPWPALHVNADSIATQVS